MGEFEKICKDIKSIKIQGATNVAKAAIRAYSLKPGEKTKKILMNLRPTEPALFNALKFLEKEGKKKILSHFKESQEIINQEVFKIIKSNSIIYTHCHSTSVVKALIYAKKKGKKFQVLSTETRPLFQGRKTAKELAKNKIKVSLFVDSAIHQAVKKSNLVLLGADAILESGVMNKIGSQVVAEEAKLHKKPVYIVSDSWKFSPKSMEIEERNFKEVWENTPKRVKIRNPAFEKINRKYIKKIISELGILNYSDFIRKADKII
ncbi:hypothetical protein AUJ84_03215 [Candidatus Pacearchaeota archaeon CG1_02_32_132]|uniref:R15P Isomerase n=1 Tax=uncultured Candidatus Pacearchaeota archaeon TaxID=2109283 RepID=A0A447IU84_9ARCH|nr:MAG: hypothetical protein AUJ84_03215 [Candidatus Pacearchaeota archaeon CG1_02_32_132]VDS11046.1 R15P Isomerase [uncultured Candidatus Pacearchaeota archaeon]